MKLSICSRCGYAAREMRTASYMPAHLSWSATMAVSNAPAWPAERALLLGLMQRT